MKNMLQNPESWVYFDNELLSFWDYFDDPQSALTNTVLLFIQAARPHFDFFLEMITHPVLSQNVNLKAVKDKKMAFFFRTSSNKVKTFLELEDHLETVKKSRRIVLLTSPGSRIRLDGFVNIQTISIKDTNAFGNVETFWRKIRRKLNKLEFDVCLVNLGPERVMVIPRLAQVYGKDAFDISFLREREISARQTFIGRVLRFVQRKLKFWYLKLMSPK